MENLETIKAVQKVQDYIENHLNDRISLYMLAQEANYSVGHTSRMFKEIVGMNPFDYIRERRLSLAARKLSDKKIKIIDVAFEFVFDSHEGFTRAFSKQFGVTPKDYIKNTPDIELFMPKRIIDHYQANREGEIKMEKKSKASTIFVQVMERPARKIILKRGKTATNYYEYCEEVDCEVWDRLLEIKEALYEPAGMWLPKNMILQGTSMYIQGVEVPMEYSSEVPEGFEIVEVGPCKMMIFQGQPYDDNDFEDAIGNLWESIKTYNPKIYGFDWDPEAAPRFQFVPQGYRGYIEGRPVKEINIG